MIVATMSSFPALSKPMVAKSADSPSLSDQQHSDALAMRYTKQLRDLAEAERKLKVCSTSLHAYNITTMEETQTI